MKTQNKKYFRSFLCILVLVCILTITVGCSVIDVPKGEQRQIADNQQNDGSGQQFYNLKDAYENALITHDDLLSIAYYFHSQSHLKDGTAYNSELMGAQYQPLAKAPETLSEEQKQEIKQALIKQVKKECPTEPITLQKISIWEYCGTYNGCVAIRVVYSRTGSQFPMSDVMVEENIADVRLTYNSYAQFLSLSDFTWDSKVIIWNANS